MTESSAVYMLQALKLVRAMHAEDEPAIAKILQAAPDTQRLAIAAAGYALSLATSMYGDPRKDIDKMIKLMARKVEQGD